MVAFFKTVLGVSFFASKVVWYTFCVYEAELTGFFYIYLRLQVCSQVSEVFFNDVCLTLLELKNKHSEPALYVLRLSFNITVCVDKYTFSLHCNSHIVTLCDCCNV